MKNAQKPDHVSLGTLINRLKEGRYVVPDFQREFEWAPWDINDLVRSIFLDYYIGSLLLWKSKPDNLKSLSCQKLFGFSGSSHPDYIILDGQQRLSAIHYAFVAPKVAPPNRMIPALYYVKIDHFMDEEHDKEFDYDWSSKRMLALLEDPVAQYHEHIFPCALLGSSTFALSKWLGGYEEHWRNHATDQGSAADSARAKEHAERAATFSKHVEALYAEYQISYIELDQDLEIDKVCDIFTKLNSTGIRLDIFDLLNALLRPKDVHLKEMYRKEETRLAFPGSDRMNVYVLQTMSILVQEYCSPRYIYYLIPNQKKMIRNPDGTREKITLIASPEKFLAGWDRAVNALDESIRLLRHPQEYGAITKEYLPYVAILPAFAAVQAHIETLHVNVKFAAQRKARHWYWASVFMQRYSGAVESTSTRDFIELKKWFSGDIEEPEFIRDFRQQAGSIKLKTEQKRTTSIYKGIFNLLIIHGARDWVTGKIPHYDQLDDHHIVPASWGAKHELAASPINSILNRTPLSAETNRAVIRDRLPNIYLREMIANIGEEAARTTLASHLISPAATAILLRDPFTPADYEAFIVEREHTVLRAIEELLIDDAFDLAPDLRLMDKQIEQIELRLRELVNVAVEGNVQSIPSHLMQKANDRLQAERRRSPSFDGARFSNLEGKLEFFDLREVEQALTSKAVWPLVSARFGTTEFLAHRFNQLASLRNGLRHSRTVDEIMRKDGEVAILWFDGALSKQVGAGSPG